MTLAVVVLAAGRSRRMASSIPKLMMPLAGRPILWRILETAERVQPEKTIVVESEALSHYDMPFAVERVRQPVPLGSGDALIQAMPALQGCQRVLVILGDVPLIQTATLEHLLQSSAALTLLAMQPEDPSGYGRILMKEERCQIREEKDANAEEKKVRLCFSGVLAANMDFLMAALPKLGTDNAQGEKYLTALVDHIDRPVEIMTTDATDVLGVNTLVELEAVERLYQKRMAAHWLAAGVQLYDRQRVDFRGDCDIGRGSCLDVNVIIDDSRIGKNCQIGSGVMIRNSVLADNVTVLPGSIIDGSDIAAGCRIGPYAHLRAQVKLEQDVIIGNFVEVKSSHLGQGCKAKHLAYLGNLTAEKAVNIGAGVITCNYDGRQKHPSFIGSQSFIGANAALVAPLRIEPGSLIAAGSTITKDVPADSLAIGRTLQKNRKRRSKV